MNILITSVGRRSYMVDYFKKALNGMGKVHVANSSDITPAFRVADKSVVTPLIYDDNYIPFLMNYCSDNKINVIVSLFDVDLYILAKNKDKFNNVGVKVIVSDEKFIKICNDKWLTYKFLSDNCFLTPVTYLDVDSFIEDNSKGIINYPVIVKPRWGMGSLSIYKADNERELKVFNDKIKREIQSSYIKYESKGNIDKSVIIQECLDYDEYGLDIINDLNGNYINTIVRKKYAMRSGETDCALVMKNKELENIGKKLSTVTKHIANLDVDLFFDGSNAYILEMNARFGGGYPFSHLAGVDLPKAIVKWCNNEVVNSNDLKIKKRVLAHKDIGIVKINDKNKK